MVALSAERALHLLAARLTFDLAAPDESAFTRIVLGFSLSANIEAAVVAEPITRFSLVLCYANAGPLGAFPAKGTNRAVAVVGRIERINQRALFKWKPPPSNQTVVL